MDLFSLHLRATQLLIDAALGFGHGEPSENYLDKVDNYLNSLGKPLRRKYKIEWKEIMEEAKVQRSKNENLNNIVLKAQGLVVKVSNWIESLGEHVDSPTRRSKQINSMLTSEIPDKVSNSKISRRLLVETFDNFMKKLILEFPNQAHDLEGYRIEFIKKTKGLTYYSKWWYLRWLKKYAESFQMYFEHQCLADEYERMTSSKEQEKLKESNAESSEDYSKEIHLHGDYVVGDKLTGQEFGDHNVNFVGNESISINAEKLLDLSREIESHYDRPDKQEVKQLVYEIQALDREGADKKTIVEKLSALLTKTAEVASVGSLVLQIINDFLK